MLDQLGTDNLYALFQHAKGKKTFRFATACSGSDIIVSYIKRLAAQLSSLLGQEVKMEHIFSCEHIPWKREWIDDNFKKDGPKFIFGPVEDLTWNTAHDHKSGNIVLVPDVDVFIACWHHVFTRTFSQAFTPCVLVFTDVFVFSKGQLHQIDL